MLQTQLRSDHRFEMAVWHKESDHPNVHEMRRGWLWWANAVLGRVSNWLALEGATAPAGFVLPFQPYFRRADVIHLHLIHSSAFFSIGALLRLSHLKPTVWTIHDAWPTTGMCLYSFGCERWLTGCRGRCPYPRGASPLRHYMPALHWQLKKRVYQHMDVTLVVASEWTRERVRRSPLLQHLPCQLIPFGIDLNVFTPHPKAESRQKLGIPSNYKVLAFRGVDLAKDLYKGMRWLHEALTIYEPAEPTCLLILQDGRDFESLSDKYKVINLGWVNNEDLLVEVLSAADVFLMPSIQEAFGLMAVESMSCGTPVIVFEGTALPGVIHAPRGGLAVPMKDSVALAGTVRYLIENDDLREEMGREGRQIAEQEYSFQLHAQRLLRLYQVMPEKNNHRNGGIVQ